MIEFIRSGGYSMYVVLLCGVTMLVMAVRAWQTRRHSAVDAVLFWGTASLATGVIGTLVGVWMVAEAVSRAGSAPSSLVWSGVGVALTTSIMGTLVFLAGLLCWSLLRSRVTRLAE
jgi:hypothetical protein